MGFFISDAMSAVDASTSQSSLYSMVIMLVIFVLIFYFLTVRPQQNRIKEHQALIDSISKGDEILTTGGLMGYVVKISDTGYITIALNDKNEVVIKRDFVTSILPKGTIKAL